MSRNKSICCRNCFSSNDKHKNYLCSTFDINEEHICGNMDHILFRDNPIANDKLLDQIQSRNHIDQHFIQVIKENIRSMEKNNQVIDLLMNNVHYLSLRTDNSYAPAPVAAAGAAANDDDAEYYDDEDDEEEEYDYDDDENIEDMLLDEIELRYLYGNNHLQQNDDEADDE